MNVQKLLSCISISMKLCSDYDYVVLLLLSFGSSLFGVTTTDHHIFIFDFSTVFFFFQFQYDTDIKKQLNIEMTEHDV